MAALRFVLYTSLFAAACALSLCLATERLVLGSLPPGVSPLHLLAVGGCLLVYNVHYLAKRNGAADRSIWTAAHRRWNAAFAAIGLLLCGVATVRMPLHVVEGYAVLALLSFAYSLPLLPFRKRRLKEFGVLKPFLLAGVWTVVTAGLPILYWHRPLAAFPIEIALRFLFLFALCVAFDVRDLDADAEAGIFTLPHRLGLRRATGLVHAALLLFSLLALVQYGQYPSAIRLVGEWLAAAFAYGAIRYVRNHPSDLAYLLWVDGAMLVYGVVLLAGA